MQVVLVEPEIPNNTGNIGRTCVALGAGLSLVHPVGFDLSEKACRRAGLDYWPRLALTEHASFGQYLASTPTARRWVFTTKATRCHFEAEFQPGDHLVFGKESAGLSADQVDALGGERLVLPLAPQERSLNLASTVCAALYEVVRQFAASGSVEIEAGRLFVPSTLPKR